MASVARRGCVLLPFSHVLVGVALPLRCCGGARVGWGRGAGDSVGSGGMQDGRAACAFARFG